MSVLFPDIKERRVLFVFIFYYFLVRTFNSNENSDGDRLIKIITICEKFQVIVLKCLIFKVENG